VCEAAFTYELGILSHVAKVSKYQRRCVVCLSFCRRLETTSRYVFGFRGLCL